jgi:hypothetical protein
MQEGRHPTVTVRLPSPHSTRLSFGQCVDGPEQLTNYKEGDPSATREGSFLL